ncbi:MAG: hypothetical protein WCK82_08345 [Bacteroidota bacterium]
MNENVINHGNGELQPGGTCDYCGTGIRYEFFIRSLCGKVSKVGCDCVAKLNRADNVLVSKVHKAKLAFEANRRQAKKNAECKARVEARKAAEAIEREANGGKTLHEIKLEEAKAKEEARRAEIAKANAWCLEVLEPLARGSDWISSWVATVKNQTIDSMTPKQLDYLKDIFGKAFGRSNSKAYWAAREVFNQKAGL